jgi:C-terminal processing protease CtpA/Prc
MTRATKSLGLFLLLLVMSSFVPARLAAEKKSSDTMTSLQRDHPLQMLQDVTDKIRKEYYDAGFHALNLDARYKEAQQKIRNAQTLSEAFGVIAWMVDGLNDTHTFFNPPSRPYVVEDPWRAKFISDALVVTAVKEGSDAASKGLKPGDQILAVEGFRPTRDTWWKMNYAFHTLAPRSGLKLAVVSPGGQPREMVVMSIVKNLPKNLDFTEGSDYWDLVREAERDDQLMESRTIETSDVLVWKLPEFMLSDEQIDAILRKASNHKALVLDLRGNPGGLLDNLARILGWFFDHDVKDRRPDSAEACQAVHG